MRSRIKRAILVITFLLLSMDVMYANYSVVSLSRKISDLQNKISGYRMLNLKIIEIFSPRIGNLRIFINGTTCLRNATLQAVQLWENATAWFDEAWNFSIPLTVQFVGSLREANTLVTLGLDNHSFGEMLPPTENGNSFYTVVMSESYFGKTCSEPADFRQKVDMLWLAVGVTHELGHVLGVGHTEEQDIMNTHLIGITTLSTLDLYGLWIAMSNSTAQIAVLPDSVPFAYYNTGGI